MAEHAVAGEHLDDRFLDAVPGRTPSPLAVLAEVELRPLVVRWRVLRGIVWWQHRRQRLTTPARTPSSDGGAADA